MSPFFWRAGIEALLAELIRKVEALSDAQAHLDSEVSALQAANDATTAALSDINTQLATIATEIANLKNANPAVDFTALDAAVTAAQGVATSAQATDTAAQGDATQGA